MAKSTEKSDAPALRLRITTRGLEPVTSFDAERLSSYRLGSEVWCTPTQDHNMKLLRKYWAILNRVVKDCPTPWKNSKQASSALKLALGVTENFKGVDGKWRVEPRSLMSLDAPEFEKYFEDAMAVLQGITGVDPLTMEAEAEQTDYATPEQAPEPEKPETTEAPVEPAKNEPTADEAAVIIKECATKLWDLANNETLSAMDRRGSLEMAKNSYKDALPNNLDTVRSIVVVTDNLIRGKVTADQARTMLSGFAGMQEVDFK